MMAGLIALIVAIIVFVLVVKIVFLVGGVLIALAAAAFVYYVAERLLGKSR